MKTISKIIASLLFTALLPIQALAATFEDVAASNSNYLAIEYLVSTGTLAGYQDGTFKPEQTINRAELMKILVAGQGIDPNAEQYNSCFPDVTSEWFAKYVCYAKENGWVVGYEDGSFKPSQTVNKVEAAKMIVGAYEITLATEESELTSSFLFTDVSSSDWFYGHVMGLVALGVIEKEGYLYVGAEGMTRGLTAEYIFRVLVAQNVEGIYTEEYRGDFLEDAGLGDLAKGEAFIKTVHFDGEVYQVESDEYVEISNRGSATMNLEGYYIMGSSGEEKYTFPSLDLAPGESVKVYTNQGDYSFESEDAVWSNGGETVTLYDSNGSAINTHTY